METPSPKSKESWIKPELILIEVNKIKQEEAENWLRILNDPEVFKMLPSSGGDGRW
jgi:hypothetical protein